MREPSPSANRCRAILASRSGFGLPATRAAPAPKKGLGRGLGGDVADEARPCDPGGGPSHSPPRCTRGHSPARRSEHDGVPGRVSRSMRRSITSSFHPRFVAAS